MQWLVYYALVAIIYSYTPPAWAQQPADITPSYKVFPESDQQSVQDKWSKEDLRSVKPLPIPELPESEFKRLFVPPEKKGEQKPFQHQDYIRAPADVNQVPFSYAGRLFFNTPGGRAACSAQFTADPRVLLTAAHCVQNQNGSWHSDFLFVQRYTAGTGPRVTAQCVGVMPGWVNDPSNKYQWDYAFLLMNQASDRGWFGLEANWSYSSAWALGYPAAIAGGEYMQAVQGSVVTSANNIVQLNHGEPNFTQGASGGAWFVYPYYYAISVNSHIYTGQTGRMYGPYFTNYTYDLFSYVRRGCQ